MNLLHCKKNVIRRCDVIFPCIINEQNHVNSFMCVYSYVIVDFTSGQLIILKGFQI